HCTSKGHAMKSIATLIMLLPLLPSCSQPASRPAATSTPVPALPDAASTSTSAIVGPAIDLARAKPAIAAVHSSDIIEVTTTASGTSALTLDSNGGVRFWPTLDGTREPVIVHFNEPVKIALGERNDRIIAAAIDESGGLQLRVLTKLGALAFHNELRNASGFIALAYIADRGLLALSADQQLHRIDDTGTSVTSFTMPPSVRAEQLRHAAGVTIALAQQNGKPVAILLNGSDAAPTWSAPIELPATTALETSALSANGKRLVVAVLAPASVPTPPAPPFVPKQEPNATPPRVPAPAPAPPSGPDSLVVVDLVARKTIATMPLATNPFSGVSIFSDHVAFVNESTVYYRGNSSATLALPLADGAAAPAVDPWVVAAPPEVEINGAPSAAATAREGLLLVGHGKHLRLVTPTGAMFLGYQLPHASAVDMHGDALLSWTGSRRSLLLIDTLTQQVSESKMPAATTSVYLDATHRLALESSPKGDGNRLQLVSVTHAEPAVYLPMFGKDAYNVQYGRESSVVAVTVNNGDTLLAIYDRKRNTLGAPFTVKGGYSLFMLDPSRTNGVVAYSVKNTGSTDALFTALRKDGSSLKVDSTFRLPASIIAVDTRGLIYVSKPVTRSDRQQTFEVYDKETKVRDLLLPAPPQLSPDGKRLLVAENARLSVFDDAGQRLWTAAAPRGSVFWSTSSQRLVAVNDGGMMTFDATTGAMAARCGWDFALSKDVPDDNARVATPSVCERLP
ncbi:MAG TPA: hypothetical protein PLF40_25270, partial [Kofleriaceae bacterium]|nr:hypothetical protein [Kofleriaceae bacterium]